MRYANNRWRHSYTLSAEYQQTIHEVKMHSFKKDGANLKVRKLIELKTILSDTIPPQKVSIFESLKANLTSVYTRIPFHNLLCDNISKKQ